jgi:hypothetical protein
MSSQLLVHGIASRVRRPPSNSLLLVLWAAFLTLLIAGPWLWPGYIFGTDWPGSRRFDFPTTTSSSAPLSAILAAVSWVVGGEVTGKLFVFVVLFAAGALAYGSLRAGGFVPRAAAATVYLVNPFVYGRLHYGQLFLLGAYAVLPWAASRVEELLLQPRIVTAVLAGTAFVVVGVFSPHVLLIAGLLAASLLICHIAVAPSRRDYFKKLVPWLIVAVGATTVASAYWLVPLLLGRGVEANVIAGSGGGDLGAYAAVPDRSLGLVPNLLGLYGFWAEDSGRFTSMKAFVPVWPAVLAFLVLIGAIGAAAAFREAPRKLSPWVGGLLLGGAIGLILEMGVSNPVTAVLVTWIDAHFAFYRGLRDAGKWAVLLAFVYSQLFGLGAVAVQAEFRKWSSDLSGATWVPGLITALLLALPLYYGNGLLFGMHGEIKPSSYPGGWYAADQILASDSHPARAMFLPWHEYMSYSFIHNQNRVVAPPAPSFFSVPIVASADPEVPGVQPLHSAEQDAMSALVRAGSGGRWAEVLKAYHIKYVLLARELDWTYFEFLDGQPGLTRVGDFGSIILYRNDLVS